MRLRRILTVFLLGACADKTPPEPDILELAAKDPFALEVSGPDGKLRTPRFGDPELERAEATFAIPRPWTVSKILRRYRDSESIDERVLLLRVLAASRDPRAAVVLGETLTHDDLDLRVAATEGLCDYFLDLLVDGGLESQMHAAEEWWHAHEAELRKEADRLARQWPER